jgi:hypothetical protein
MIDNFITLGVKNRSPIWATTHCRMARPFPRREASFPLLVQRKGRKETTALPLRQPRTARYGTGGARTRATRSNRFSSLRDEGEKFVPLLPVPYPADRLSANGYEQHLLCFCLRLILLQRLPQLWSPSGTLRSAGSGGENGPRCLSAKREFAGRPSLAK